MSAKKPLVISDGQIEQIQSGDTLDAVVAEQEVIVQTNNEVGAIVIGTPVYNDAANGVKKARANAAATIGVLGLVKTVSISAGATGNIITSGVLAATTVQWDAVAGTTGGLVFGTIYYLDPATAGKLTSTAPITVTQYVVAIGRAISTTELKLDVMSSILL